VNLQRAITVVASPSVLRSIPGPSSQLPRYVFVLSLGRVFQWTAGSSLQDDGLTVVVPNTGGFQGAWIYQRSLPTATGLPVALTGAANVHLTVGGGAYYELPTATLTANTDVYLDVTNAAAGDELEFMRFDVTAYTYTVHNNGGTPGVLWVMPASSRSFGVAYFDGSNWRHKRSSLTL
jgi:hypothetical protein